MGMALLLLASIVLMVVATTKLKVHPFLALLFAAFFFGICAPQMSLKEVVDSVNQGFGGTIGYIGIVIVAGAIIGTFLEKSGGAFRLAEAALRLTGRKNVPLAMALVGYVVSIPVFCDSGFVLLSPLTKALARKAGISLAGVAIALCLGLLTTHAMVPPTPGPIAAAGILRADLGLVILWGLLVSAVTLLAGWLFAVKFAARTYISPDQSDSADAAAPSAPSADHGSVTDLQGAPSAAKSLVPILLPIVLIVLNSISAMPNKPFGEGAAVTLLQFVGQPVVALLIGVLAALLLPKKLEREMLSVSGWVGQAVLAAATIIIITGAGGSFGKVLQNSGVADEIGRLLKGNEQIGIWLPFIIAAGIKTAQGSSTVSIITTAGIMMPLLGTLGLDAPHAKALVVVAIGAGSMVVSHANDSYFWVVTQFSNMSVRQGFKFQTLGTLVLGVTAAGCVWVLSWFLI